VSKATRILVVEENPANQLLAASVLERDGIKVHLASTGLDWHRIAIASSFVQSSCSSTRTRRSTLRNAGESSESEVCE